MLMLDTGRPTLSTMLASSLRGMILRIGVFDVIDVSRGLLHANAGRRAHVQLDLPGVDFGKKLRPSSGYSSIDAEH